MRVCEQLEPKRVFAYFEEICGIPHGSGNEKTVSDYCVAFAKKHGLEVWQDEAWNVVIVKEASAGYEDREPLILQGHLDMVCEKKPEEIRSQSIETTVQDIQRIVEENNVLNFFKSASRLSGKIHG